MDHLGTDPSGNGSRWEAVYKSELTSVDEAETQVVAIAEKLGFDEDDLHKIGIALREGMVNAVVHGNQYSAEKQVFLAVSSQEGNITVTIRDQGSGFDVSKVPDPLAEENLLRESGRGILLMQAFMDEFQVRRLPHGTEITMVKYQAS
jgi:serine/threonine-protein kinase RsbW